MQFKPRVLILFLISLMLFISFKILEPEINDHPGGHEVVQEQDYVDPERDHFDVLAEEARNEMGYAGEDKEEDVKESDHTIRVERLIELYDFKWDYKVPEGINPYDIAASWVKPRSLHPEIAPEMGAVLHLLSTENITHADVGHKGTQLKLTLTLTSGQKVIFKPQWFSRDHVIEGRPYDGADRHNAEIAAFHLNRLLNYQRVPLVVGRTVDLLTDVLPVASDGLLKTFFTKGPNLCFYGKCLYCKSKADGVCANGTSLEGAVVIFLPLHYRYTKHRHPWQRTYLDNRKARWEVHNNYCDEVKALPMYDHGPLLMDMVDACVFDYLIGNADRHHYETFEKEDESMLIMWDSGKGFGNPHHDERSILAPLYQCCRIRQNTYTRLKMLTNGVLTEVLRRLTDRDPIAPVLSDAHYTAMDRRLITIINTVDKCVEKLGPTYVFVYDKYSQDIS